MSKKSLVPVNLIVSASAPSTPTILQGDTYYNTTDNALYIYNGTAWDKQNNIGYAALALNGGTTTLTNTSASFIAYTSGTTAGTILLLPDVSTIPLGSIYYVSVTPTPQVPVSVRTSASTVVFAAFAGGVFRFVSTATTGTTAAVWNATIAGSRTDSTTGQNNILSRLVYDTSPTLYTPTIVQVNTTNTTTGGSLWPLQQTSLSSINSGLTTGNLEIANGTGFSGTLSLASGSSPNSKTVNIGTSATTGTTTVNIGTTSGANSIINLNGTINGTFPAPNFGYTTTVTSATLVTLTNTSDSRQAFTGSTAQNVNLPVASTLTVGDAYYIFNDSTAVITVRTSAGAGSTVLAQPAGTMVQYICILASGTTTASWEFTYDGFNTLTGTGNSVLSTSPTLTTPVIDSVSASAATGINPSLYANTTTGNISIGGGLTTGQLNLATGGTGVTPIAIGHTNATIGLTGNTTITGTLVAGSSTNKTTAYPVEVSGTTTGTVTTSAQMAGFLGMPQNPRGAAGVALAYTITSSDAGKVIYVSSTPTTPTITIPANTAVAFEIGTTIVIMNDIGAATSVSIAITTDTLVLAGTGTTGTRTLSRYGVATLTKVTATRWFISGNGLT